MLNAVQMAFFLTLILDLAAALQCGDTERVGEVEAEIRAACCSVPLIAEPLETGEECVDGNPSLGTVGSQTDLFLCPSVVEKVQQ